MLELLVMRHAQSDWESAPGEVVPDIERPLSKRGKCDALAQGELLNQLGLIPDVIVSSPAKRARSTAKRVARGSGYRGEVVILPALYMQGWERILVGLANTGLAEERVMIVGHNPDFSELVSFLTGQATEMGTAHIACLQVPTASWLELREQPTCRMLRHLAPARPVNK
ncbi:MAG: histidine phosphatase family protein [Chloroflexi bacterium]|nr:histidine phosphatase family protein [Chloroflexota bacterium]